MGKLIDYCGGLYSIPLGMSALSLSVECGVVKRGGKKGWLREEKGY